MKGAALRRTPSALGHLDKRLTRGADARLGEVCLALGERKALAPNAEHRGRRVEIDGFGRVFFEARGVDLEFAGFNVLAVG